MISKFVIAGALLATVTGAINAQSPLPSFQATSLTGQTVSKETLIGQPTVLIITPSKSAAKETRQWAQELRKNIDVKKIRVRDVLAIDLPFFISKSDAIGRAKQKIPKQYHDQTWLLEESSLEKALGIPTSSEDAFVLVLNAEGKVVTRVQGHPTRRSIQEIVSTVSNLAS